MTPAATLNPPSANGTWLTAAVFPPVAWIVPGFIPEGLTLLVAPPKAGKSWLVYAAALARSTGGTVLGQAVTQSPVLYLALEDGWRRLQERGRKLLAPGDSIPEALEFIIRPGDKPITETIREWLTIHGGRNALVVVDTLGRVKPPAPAGRSAYEHDYAVVAALKALVDEDPGSAMVVVHHDRKAASDDFVDAVSGTHGIGGAADTIVVIRRPRTEGDSVICVTGRDVTEAEYAATFNAGHWSLAATDLAGARQQAAAAKASAGLGERSARIIQLVASTPGGVRASAVAEMEGIAANAAGAYLGRLADEGRIVKVARGLYTSVESMESVETDELSPGDTGSQGSTQSTVSTQVPGPTCTVCGNRLLIDVGRTICAKTDAAHETARRWGTS